MKKFALAVLFGLLLAIPVSAAEFNKNLRFGMTKNTDVSKLQEYLTSENLYAGPITGNFFSLTLKAVKVFQKRELLPATGFIGSMTRIRLNQIFEQQLAGQNQESDYSWAPESVSTNTSDVVEKLDQQSNAVQQPITNEVDLCRNFIYNQTTIPLGMYRSTDGDCFSVPTPISSVPIQTKPIITKLISNPEKARVGQTVKISYKAENAKVCVISDLANIEVPFVGRLPEGETDQQLLQKMFTDNKFTLYLICADKDWNIISRTLEIPYNPVFDITQPTSFFSAHGGNLGNGGTGVRNGVPLVEISPLKIGARAVLVMESKTYQLDPDGIHFWFTDLSYDPTFVYAGFCTNHTYAITYFYSDEYNPSISSVPQAGGFCLNNMIRADRNSLGP